MITLSEEARMKLRQFLETDLYARAKHLVLEDISIEVVGSIRDPQNIALDLAVKEGVLTAFKKLEELTNPPKAATKPVAAKTIQKRPTDTDQ